VRAYAWRRAPSLADEIVAETFLVAWRRLEDVPDDALPWLFGVARNFRANLHRSDRRRSALVERLGPGRRTPAGPRRPGPRSGTRSAARSPASPRPTARSLLLTAWEDLDRGQVAKALGCSRATVAVRLFRARRRLEAVLDEDEAAHPSDRPLPGGVSDARS
jgi:RNA polymerase sigma-70 factor, ECF subfamily